MNKTKKWWMPVPLACLLVAILVGMAGATPDARPLAAVARTHGISVYHCIPRWYTVDWEYDVNFLRCDTAGTCYFYCPVDPPVKGKFKVQKVKMFAHDTGVGEVCMVLRQYRPNRGNATDRIGRVCTSDSYDDPQVVVGDPADFVVSPKHDVYVAVEIDGTAPRLYGFNLVYVPL